MDFNETCRKYLTYEWALLEEFPRSEVKGQGREQTDRYYGGGMHCVRRGSLVLFKEYCNVVVVVVCLFVCELLFVVVVACLSLLVLLVVRLLLLLLLLLL